MKYEDHLYHCRREQECRERADHASDPDIQRRHRELAELHAGLAAAYVPAAVTAAPRAAIH